MSIDGTKNCEHEIKNEERDFYQAYYLLQSQRQSQHETNRLTVSNFILAGSLVALGLAINSKYASGVQLMSLVISVVAVNLLAILYARRSRIWVKVHQTRANYALKALSMDLHNMQAGIDLEKLKKVRSGKSSLFNLTRSEFVQIYFHVVVILAVVGAILTMAITRILTH